MLIVPEALIAQLVSPEDAFAAVEATFAAMARGEARNFPVVREALGDGRQYGFKSGLDAGGGQLPLGRAEQLVEQGLRVPHGAVRPPRDESQGVVLRLQPLLADDVPERLENLAAADGGEVEPLAAAEDRHRDLLHLGGGEDEFDVRGWLLERLE